MRKCDKRSEALMREPTVTDVGSWVSWQLPTEAPARKIMVFVAVTSAGLAEAPRRAAGDDAIWCGSDTISEAKYVALKRPRLSRFDYSLADLELNDGVIATVEEHHPGETIWVEAAPRA